MWIGMSSKRIIHGMTKYSFGVGLVMCVASFCVDQGFLMPSLTGQGRRVIGVHTTSDHARYGSPANDHHG